MLSDCCRVLEASGSSSKEAISEGRRRRRPRFFLPSFERGHGGRFLAIVRASWLAHPRLLFCNLKAKKQDVRSLVDSEGKKSQQITNLGPLYLPTSSTSSDELQRPSKMPPKGEPRRISRVPSLIPKLRRRKTCRSPSEPNVNDQAAPPLLNQGLEGGSER